MRKLCQVAVAIMAFALCACVPAQVINCSSFATSGACGIAFEGSSNNQAFFSAQAGGSVSGGVINFVPSGATHNGAGLWYQTKVNVQAFTATFTFVPNGYNLAFVIQNENNNGSPFTYGGGAGGEGGFSQFATGGNVYTTNVFALQLDSYSPLTNGGSFTYSSAQIYQTLQVPSNPLCCSGYLAEYATTKISSSPVPLNSPAGSPATTTGDTYSVTVTYDGNNLTLNMYDVTAGGSCPGASCFTNTWSGVYIPAITGATTGVVGFTSGIGTSTTSPLYIKSFTYTVNTPAALSGTAAWNANSTYYVGTASVASPVYSLAPGTYAGTQSVSMSSSTAGAYICYALSASAPALTPQPDNNGGCSAGTLYSGPVSVSSTATLYAMAGANNANFSLGSQNPGGLGPPSPLVAGTYTIGGGCGLSPGATVAQIQSAINTAAANSCAAPNTSTVNFAAGSYTISSQLTIPCPTVPMVIQGPIQPTNVWPITPTALLSSTLGTNWAFNGTACANGTTLQYLRYNGNHPPGGGGGFLHVPPGMNNLTVQWDWMYGNYAIQTTSQPEDAFIWIDGYSGTHTQNTTIQWNRFGYTGSGDCGGPTGLMTLYGGGGGPGTCSASGYAPPSGNHTCYYQGSPNLNSGGGYCAAIGIHNSTDNLTIKNNSIQEQEQGLKCFQNNGGTVFSTNTVVQFNDLSGIHRIGFESQCNDGLVNVDSNDFHDPYYPNANQWGLSLPQGNTNSTNNLLIANVAVRNDRNGNPASYAGAGLEFWGGLTSSNNMIQGKWVAGINWGFQPGGASINNNIIQMSDYTSFIACCDQGASNPPSQSGNVTGQTISSRVSAAPTAAPSSGAQSFPLTVTLTDPGFTSGAGQHGNTGIWYTIDGTTPVPGSGSAKRLDSGGTFVLAGPATVQAVGMWGALNQPTSYPSGYGFVPSAVVSAAYTSGGAVVLSSATIAPTGGVSTLQVGATVQMIVTCHYSDGSTTGCNTTDSHGNAVTAWASSSGNVTISGSGLATGAAVGTGTITATVTGGITTSPGAVLTVSASPLTLSSISLATTGGVSAITAGNTNQLLTTCHYNDGTSTSCNTMDSHGNAVTAANSSAPTIATVTSPGSLVTGVAAGSTNLSTTVTPTPSMLGASLENVTGATGFGFINEIYGVTGTSASGYTPGDCHITIPATTNWTAGKLWTCLLVLGTPTTQNASALCSNSFTLTGTSWPGGDIVIPMGGVCPTLPPDTGYWVGSTTSQTTASPTQGFSNCNSSCSGGPPAFGSGTYPYRYVANTFGSYTNLPTTLTASGSPGQQVSQYILLTTTPATSNTLPLTVNAAAPTLVSAYITGSSSLVVPNTAQMAAKCHYSTGADQDCTVADIYGDKVTAWLSSDPTKATVQNVGAASPGLVTAVAAGTPSITAVINNAINSTAFPITVTSPAVTLTGVSLSLTGGVTGLFVGATNQLKATCTYSDGSHDDCTTTDVHGTLAHNYASTTPAHATVNATSGLVTGVAPGATTFTAVAGSFTSNALPLNVFPVLSGVYTITVSGPVRFSGTVQF